MKEMTEKMSQKEIPLSSIAEIVESTVTYTEVRKMLEGTICSNIETLIAELPDKEHIGLAIKDDTNRYMAIQTCDDGYDYTFFNESFELLDGGQLDNSEFSMAQAIFELLKDIHAQYAPLEVYDYETLWEKEELSQKHRFIENRAAYHAKEVLSDEGLLQDINITGFKLYESPFDTSDQLDYDVLLQYEGNIREDDFFNLLCKHKCIIDCRPIDFTPIRPDKSGTIKEYLRKLEGQQVL